MKKHLVALTVLFTLLVNTGICQKKIPLIRFDFSTKQFYNLDSLDKLNNGDFYQIKIEGINLNLYKVSIEKSDSIIAASFSTPDFISFDLDKIEKLTSSLTSSLSASLTDVDTTTLIGSKSLVNEIISRMINEKDLLVNFKSELSKIKQGIDSIYFETNLYLLRSKVENSNSTDFENLGKTYDFKSKLQRIIEIRKAIQDLQSKVLVFELDYINFSQQHKNKFTESLTINDSLIKASYTSISESILLAEESINVEKVNQLLSAVLLQDNNKSNCYLSIPQQLNGDVCKLKILIEPINEEFPLQKYSTELQFPKVNSKYAGVGLSFYYSGLHDESFSIRESPLTDTTSQYTIIDEELREVEFGMALMLRSGIQLNDERNFGIHFAFGPGISIDDKVKPRLLLGGGAAFGKKHMIVLDGGVIGGFSERRSMSYPDNGPLLQKPEQITVSDIQFSYFITLGYFFKIGQR